MKKIILAVVLVALMVPTTFAARSYLHSDGNWTGYYGGQDTGEKDADGNPIYAPSASNPDREIDDKNYEIKAENYNWPASYDFVDAAVIPVKMEVGFWIKLNTKDKVLILKQVEIHKYAGQVSIEVETNVNIEMKASYTPLTGMPTEVDSLTLNTIEVKNAGDPGLVVHAPGVTVKVYLKLKDVNLKNFNVETQVGKCTPIGKVTLRVRPLVRPNIQGAC